MQHTYLSSLSAIVNVISINLNTFHLPFSQTAICQRVCLVMTIMSHSRLQCSAQGSIYIFTAPFDLWSVIRFTIQSSRCPVHNAVILQGESLVHREQAETTCGTR